MTRTLAADIAYYPGPGSLEIAKVLISSMVSRSDEYPQGIIDKADASQLAGFSLRTYRSFKSIPNGINLSVNYYANKSPVLGVAGEYCANRSDANFELLIMFTKSYFLLVFWYCPYDDSHYKKWLNGEYHRLFGVFQSIIESAGRAVRDAMKNGDAEHVLIGWKAKKLSGNYACLLTLDKYAAGQSPISKSSGNVKSTQKFYQVSEGLGAFVSETLDHNDFDAIQEYINIDTPDYINTKSQLVNKINKINGRANQLNRINQLHVNNKSALRPTLWLTLDYLLTDKTIDVEVRRLLCLILLSGRPAQYCLDNMNKLLRRSGLIVLDLNFPTTKMGSSNSMMPVAKSLELPIPVRYRNILKKFKGEHVGSLISCARKVLREFFEPNNISMEMIQRLFVYLVSHNSGKTLAAAMFQSPIPTSKTQLHYSIFDKDILTGAFEFAWLEYESVLSEQLGLGSIKSSQSLQFVGSDSFSQPIEIQNSLQCAHPANKEQLLRFVRFSAVNGSRAVINQSSDAVSKMLDGVIHCLVNDKKRSGAQFSRLSIMPAGITTSILGTSITAMAMSQLTFHYLAPTASPMSPRHFSTKNQITFQMNTMRKFRRSFLMSLGVAEEFIDVLNGHYTVGQVVLSPQSSVSILDCQSQLIGPLRLFLSTLEGMINE